VKRIKQIEKLDRVESLEGKKKRKDIKGDWHAKPNETKVKKKLFPKTYGIVPSSLARLFFMWLLCTNNPKEKRFTAY